MCEDGNPSKCAAEIRAGERAPFSGQVLTATLAAVLAVRAEGCRRRIELARRQEVERARAAARWNEKLWQVERRGLVRERDLYAREAERLSADRLSASSADSAWYDSAWFWIVVGAAGMAAAFGLARAESAALPGR